MPLYLLSVCYPADSTKPSPDVLDKIMTDLATVRSELVASGAWVFAGGLHPASTATTVLEQDGEVVLTDGPFVESKEQIGGITIIEVANLDEALSWASKQSAAIGTAIEVRPFEHGSGR
jgi:hypothetical protein